MSDFLQDANETFGTASTTGIEALFQALCLPLPAAHDEYVSSIEGMLVFLTQFGLVLRIEGKEPLAPQMGSDWERVNDHPLVLQPLGTIDCGNALVELCPGTHVGLPLDELKDLTARLDEDGVRFYDAYGPNAGYMMIDGQKTPMVIDRLGVTRSHFESVSAAALLQKHGQAQASLSPLKEAFSHAINQPKLKSQQRSMQYFWNLCRDFKASGQLVCGWQTSETEQNTGIEHKSLAARVAAQNYLDRRFPG